MALEVKLNSLLRIRPVPPYVCEVFKTNKDFELSDARYVKLLLEFDRAMPISAAVALTTMHFGVDFGTAESIIAGLLQRNILVSNNPPSSSAEGGVAHWINHGWLNAFLLQQVSARVNFCDAGMPEYEDIQNDLMGEFMKQEALPPLWKGVESTSFVVLPKPAAVPNLKFSELILKRRSNGPPRATKMTVCELSSILYLGNIKTKRLRQHTQALIHERPSALLASAHCSLETYVFIFDVDGISPGLFLYSITNHSLVPIRMGHLREEAVSMCMGQRTTRQSSCMLVISVSWNRYMFRYRSSRAYRALLVDIAEFAHRYILLATMYDLGTFLTPAIRDEYAAELIGTNIYEEAPMYVVAAG
jgi:SagB-type dehydrogenase family enzyme